MLKKLGPGLLYAAAAIGVSHLVQSTRAGANFGHQLLWAVVIANLIKYPFFRVGPLYTACSKRTLLEGYNDLGKWAIVLFYIMTLATMFTVQAAVTVVTAGLAINLFGLSLSAPVVSFILLLICSVILMIGKYSILDNFIKIIIIVLTITTIISVSLALTSSFPKPLPEVVFNWDNKVHLFFLVALFGWMPAPMDIPIWHSLWSKEKMKTQEISPKEALLDFNIGYIGTAFLALCFLLLGSLVMYRSGEIFSDKAAVFAGQLISMYTTALGDWSYLIIAVAAFTTMFSTTLTCLDAFPRILTEANRISFKKESPFTYHKWLVLTVAVATLILFKFLSNMKAFVDLATTLSFIVGPVYAYLNMKVLSTDEVGEEYKGGAFLKYLMQGGLVFLILFSGYFLYVRFIS